MSTNSSIDAFKKYKDLVEDHILDFIPEVSPLSKNLYEIMRYALLTGGKRIRPVLVLASCDMFNTPLHFVLPNACAVEYIHTYSLIHDDLPAMDNDDLRRGKPTCHKVFGEANAILAGDGLLSAAFECLNKDMLMYLDDPDLLKRKVRAAYSLSKGCGCRGMVAGQITDIEAENMRCSEDIFNYINYNKTAMLIRSSVLSGGFLGGMDASTREDLMKYGENIGMAFQLADDIEDVKSGQDDKRSTYPSLYGLDRAVEKANEYIVKAKEAIEKYYDHAEVYRYLAELLERKING
jgi:geranylgeranyl diphosphate synthase type II